MHAAWLADELDIAEVVVPWSPGTFSAWGMLQTDMRHDLVRTFYRPLDGLDPAEVDALYRGLAGEGAELLAEEGIAEDDRYVARSADMRYVGQEYSVNVQIGETVDLHVVADDFHRAHHVRYGHSTPGAPVELVNLRLAAFGRIAGRAAPFRAPADGADPEAGTTSATFDGEAQSTSLLLRERLRPGHRQAGPALIEEPGSTTVVPPGFDATVDDHGNLLLRRTG